MLAGLYEVLEIDASGTPRVVAGNGQSGAAVPGGLATDTALSQVTAVAFDPQGRVVFESGARIMRIEADGTLTSLAGGFIAGSSGDGGLATAAEILGGGGLAYDTSGRLVVGSGMSIRRIDASGVISTVATATVDVGPMSFDGSGNLFFIGDGHIVMRMNATGSVTNVTSTAGPGISPDGTPASQAQFENLGGIVVTSDGRVLVNDTIGRIREVAQTTGSAPGAPGVPTGVSASPANASGTVSFVPPGIVGESAITGYTATCSSTDGGTAGTATGEASPIVVTGLSNGHNYTCTATATNAVGAGIASAPSNAFVPVTVPDPPAGLNATPGTGSVSISFTPPANDGGSAILSYTMTCTSSDGGTGGSSSGSSSPTVVTGLSIGRTYTCAATATNDVGTSLPSAPSNNTVTTGCAGPCVSVGDRSMLERDSSTQTMMFPVTLSHPATSTVTVHYAVTGVTATGGTRTAPGVDFKLKSGTLTFTPNARTGRTAISASIAVIVDGDTTVEADETFLVTLSNPSGGYALGSKVGTGTIVNDDGITTGLTLGAESTSIVAASNGTQSLKFEITVSGKSTSSFTVHYAITPGSATYSPRATQGGDYGGVTSGTLSFTAGVKVKAISVPIWADPNQRDSKTFTLTLFGLTGTGVTLLTPTATATIFA